MFNKFNKILNITNTIAKVTASAIAKLSVLPALIAITTLTMLTSCASTDEGRAPASFGGSHPSNAHPASYITDTFRVNRPLPKHKPGPDVNFYFKKCDMVGDNWPISNTNYQCEYP
ncbi:MAG: hypothetical protein KDD38_09500 [Bdellovibrionales bacterium]|nr:hypothetical protein [Bdellovibrionales bacterium]